MSLTPMNPEVEIESLEFRDLEFTYPGRAPILNNVTFQFPLGQTLWLDGESGSGKTSVFRLLLGLVAPTRGDILINGKSLVEMSFMEFQPYRLQMGFGFETGGILNNRTLLDNLTLPLLFHSLCSEDEAVERAMDYLTKFGIADDARQLPASVTGSKRKCVLLSRALIHRPQMVLLDDPTTGLSGPQTEALMGLLKHHRQQLGLRHTYFTSQRPFFVKSMEAKTIRIMDGQLQSEEDLLKAWGVG